MLFRSYAAGLGMRSFSWVSLRWYFLYKSFDAIFKLSFDMNIDEGPPFGLHFSLIVLISDEYVAGSGLFSFEGSHNYLLCDLKTLEHPKSRLLLSSLTSYWPGPGK